MIFLVRQFAGLLANYHYNTVTSTVIIAVHKGAWRPVAFNPGKFAIAGNL
ncbi:hypothetical protein EV561_101102 [Rhizobium sp. BK376]|nr:hypothetical protein EV561_101102 [Rhizobium sp. BK376]